MFRVLDVLTITDAETITVDNPEGQVTHGAPTTQDQQVDPNQKGTDCSDEFVRKYVSRRLLALSEAESMLS